jgi:hypothetical protein
MTKVVQALLSGVLFTFIIDFFLFLGLKLNYIKPLGVDVFYNVFFVDNQNWTIYFAISMIVGFLIMYANNFLKLTIIGSLFAAVFLTLIPSIGYSVGEKIFMKKDITLHNKKFTFRGDVYYIGRKKITFYDKDLKKVILLDKNEILENINEI